MIGQLLKAYNIQAKKQLSQNFILNDQVLRKIAGHVIGSSNPALSRIFLEVGPGPGSITRALISRGHEMKIDMKKLAVIEKDERFLTMLAEMSAAAKTPFKIIPADALKLPHSEILAALNIESVDNFENVTLFGNLPFNISTALLIQWMHMIHLHHGIFKVPAKTRMILTFQKEVADRLLANPHTKEWSRLSVLVQALCKVRPLYALPASVFTPRPKVDATLVEVVPLETPLLSPNVSSFCLEYLLSTVFTHRRKMLRNSFIKQFVEKMASAKGGASVETIYIAENILAKVNVSPEMRPEQLEPKLWCKLTEHCINEGYLDLKTIDKRGFEKWIV